MNICVAGHGSRHRSTAKQALDWRHRHSFGKAFSRRIYHYMHIFVIELMHRGFLFIAFSNRIYRNVHIFVIKLMNTEFLFIAFSRRLYDNIHTRYQGFSGKALSRTWCHNVYIYIYVCMYIHPYHNTHAHYPSLLPMLVALCSLSNSR